MKIAIIGIHIWDILIPFGWWTEKFTYNLSQWLQKIWHEVTLFASKKSYVPDLHMICVWNSSEDEFFWEVFSHIQNWDYDVIIYSSLICKYTFDFEKYNIAFIVIFHFPIYDYLRDVLLMQRSQNTHFVLVSRSQKTQYPQLQNSHIIYNWVEIQKNKQVEKEDYFVWFWRICDDKWTHIALQACKKLNLNLKIIGKIENPLYFQTEIEPYLNTNIQYFWVCETTHLQVIVSQSQWFLFTSLWNEPFGYTIIESLTWGTPVYGFDSWAAKEILHESVSELTSDHSVNGLMTILENRKTFDSKVCQDYAKKHFSLEKMIDNYDSLIWETTK